MADAPNDVKQQGTVWTGGVPAARLLNEELPANPKRVIRTFAADMAALKGTPQAAVPEPPPVKAAPVAAPPAPRMPAPMQPPIPVRSKDSLSEAVGRINLPQEEPVAPEPHLPPLRKQGAPAPRMYVQRPESAPPPLPRQQAPVQEAIVHETQPSFLSKLFAALFGRREQAYVPPPAANAPTPQPVYDTPPQPLTPQPHVEAPISEVIPSATADEEAANRDAVLARLRARVSTYQTENVPPPPVFPTPPPAPLRARPPVSAPIHLPGAGANDAVSERLRTWSNDFSAETQTRGASAFSILAAQADSPRPTSVEVQPKVHGLVYAIAGTVLVVGGSLALYFSYNYFASHSPVPVISSAPAGLITGDDSATVEGTGQTLLTALGSSGDAQIPGGNIRLIYLSVASTTPTGTVTLTESGADLINALNLPAPSILLRNIGAKSSVGVVHAGDETRPFFILAATSYERTFAGMLSWEPTIGQDLSALYPSYGFLGATGTSTPVAPRAPAFIDETVQSHDVRALKDSENRTILIYGFRDQSTLIIARDETAFGILLARLSASE